MTDLLAPYDDLLRRALDAPVIPARNGSVRRLPIDQNMRFDLSTGHVPITTRKRCAYRSAWAELCWFLSGSTNLRELQRMKCRWWDAYRGKGPHAYRPHDLGPIYGEQMRCLHGTDADGEEVVVDQVRRVIDGIKADPWGRRHVWKCWNAAQIKDMALPPCHGDVMFQVEPAPDGKKILHMSHHQRSGDLFLGVPINILSYALLLRLVARECGMAPGILSHTITDAHLYCNHEEAAREYLSRDPSPSPRLHFAPEPSGVDETWPLIAERLRAGEPLDDVVVLEGYRCHGSIKAPLSP